jgi:hypothetical protein
MGVVVVCALLAVPASHYVWGHNAHRKLLRAILLQRGPEVPVTDHERHHNARTSRQRAAAEAAWSVYFLATLIVAVSLH